MKTYIEQKGLTQANVAKLLQCHRSTLHKWITQVNKIPLDTLEEFCQLMDLDEEQQRELFCLAGYKSLTQLYSVIESPEVVDAFPEVLPHRKRVLSFVGLAILAGLVMVLLVRYLIFPSWAKAQNQAGLAALSKNDVTGARQSFERAIWLDPTLAVAYYNLAELYAQRIGDKQTAIEYFERARAIDPNFWSAYDSLSRLYNETEQYDQARIITEVGLEGVAYPDRVETLRARYGLLSNQGWAYFGLSQYNDAKAALEEAVKLEPALQAAEHSLGFEAGSLRRSTAHYFLLKLCQLEHCSAEKQQLYCEQARILSVPMSGYFHERKVDIEEICAR
ncbi:MAG TPA: tetratricopeptide repeat protein [Anaerolineae bacterium]|nr:tetratricopeptide repeat protein [Anaerolineae bacterium]MCB9105462.1 tetratricopeptide repeat protein [Anaerolineales bacterium]HRV92449.1 tetratricopeptide repeat protein [Anaerolineae bacterium]